VLEDVTFITNFHGHTVHLDNYQSFVTNWCTVVHQLVKKLWHLLLTWILMDLQWWVLVLF